MLRVHGARTQLHWKAHLKITICFKCSYAILPVYWRMVLGQPANTSSTHLLPTLVNGFNVTLKGALWLQDLAAMRTGLMLNHVNKKISWRGEGLNGCSILPLYVQSFSEERTLQTWSVESFMWVFLTCFFSSTLVLRISSHWLQGHIYRHGKTWSATKKQHCDWSKLMDDFGIVVLTTKTNL